MPARLYDAPSKNSSRAGKDFGLPAIVLSPVGPIESLLETPLSLWLNLNQTLLNEGLHIMVSLSSLHFSSHTPFLQPINHSKNIKYVDPAVKKRKYAVSL